MPLRLLNAWKIQMWVLESLEAYKCGKWDDKWYYALHEFVLQTIIAF